IRYTIEIAPRPFGYFRYICLVKFLKGKPDLDEVKKVLEAEPAVLYAAALKGDYDLFIYMLAENTKVLEDKLYEIRSKPAFALNASLWNVTYITYAYGYVLLRDAFFEDLKAKVWHRTKETPRKPHDAITDREFKVLRLLNENSRLEFVEMDKRLGFERGASQYVYHKLIDRGIILRATITMQALPKKYDVLAVCAQTEIGFFNENRKRFLQQMINLPNTPASTYALVGDIGAPYGLLFVVPSYSENIKEIEDMLNEFVKGATISTSIVSRVLLGSIGYRRISKEVTLQFPTIEELSQKEEQQKNKQTNY
ncbi:MAG: Lrp/AsnC family transcriptional regulator, partial [Candidatus Micrarchaeaceae archaeon]